MAKKQEVVWVEGSGGVVRIGKECPDNVWTLLLEKDKNKAPILPFYPVHRENAFLEDQMHDWKFDKGGWLRYFSRVTRAGEGVWILLEYKDG